jgi:hypothetical protein
LLYNIDTLPVDKQNALGKSELEVLLQVVKELSVASHRDPVISTAVQTFFEKKANEGITISPALREFKFSLFTQVDQQHYLQHARVHGLEGIVGARQLPTGLDLRYRSRESV